ncbi:hypothetical protein DM02DRAFT_519153, partial [Periconia macrospinosa]
LPRLRRSSIASSASSRHSELASESFFTMTFQNIPRPFKSLKRRFEDWKRESRFNGWRMGLMFGCCLSAIVLCCNIAIMTLGAIKGYKEGISTLIKGDDAVISRWNTVLHALLNALSTALLSASNYTMQVLSSPTRKDIDKAHRKGKWLTIGLLSPRNLGEIPLKRRLLWMTMASSSIPLHLFYNAAIFKVTSDTFYEMYTVDVNSEYYQHVKSTPTEYSRMSNKEWFESYSQRFLQKGDIHFVFDYVATSTRSTPNETNYFRSTTKLARDLNIKELTGGAVSSSSPNSAYWISISSSYYNETGSSDIKNWEPQVMLRVVEAFSKRPQYAPCEIQISLYFMLVVSIFNLIKLLVMCWVLWTDRSIYLVTLGDASASFLETPDPCTYAKCMLGKDEFLGSLGEPPDHPVSCAEEKENLEIRASGTWLPRTTRYIYPINSTGKGIYTVL